MSRFLWTVLLFLALHGSAIGLDRGRSIRQFLHSSWTASDGAPLDAFAMAQTSDGYLWLGTFRGLFRFDGIHFESYDLPPDAASSQQVSALLATPDGGLWVGFRFGGASFLKAGRIVSYKKKEGLPSATVHSFALDTDGVVWAATSAGLERFATGLWRGVGADWNLTAGSATNVFADRQGRVWVSSLDTLYCLPRGDRSFQRIFTIEPVSLDGQNGAFGGMCQLLDGSIWIADDRDRLYPVAGLDRNRSIVLAKRKAIRVSGPISLLSDRDDGIWIVTYGSGIARIRNPNEPYNRRAEANAKDVEGFRSKDGLTDDLVHCLLEDREGNIWLATRRGLDRFRERNVVPSSFPGAERYAALAVAEDGGVWAGAYDKKLLMRSLNGALRSFTPAIKVSAAFCDPFGTLWFGGQDVLVRSVKNGFEHVPMPGAINPQTLAEVQAISSDKLGGLWISVVRYGVFRLQNGVWTPFGGIAALPRSPAITIWTDSQGGVWFGYPDNRIAVLEGSHLKQFSQSNGLKVGNVFAIHGGHQSIWIGGEWGLAAFQAGRVRMLATLTKDKVGGISGIVEEANGDLWLNQSTGIVHIPAKEIAAKLRDEQYSLRYELFDFRDGVIGFATQLRPVPSAVLGKDGRIWFSSSEGVTWVDPARIYRNRVPPPVSIQSLAVSGHPLEAAASVTLPVLPSNLQIDYAALSLSIPERVHFRYRLEGHDRQWQDAGTRRSAFYSELGPGHYVFRVIACNNDGLWNETGATVSLSVPPAYYQTLWFKALCAAFGCCMLWLFYLMRLRRFTSAMESRFEERLVERTRIARALHDTLLQGFLSASLHVQLAETLLSADSKAKPVLSRGSELMQQVIEDGRQAVRGLRTTTNSSADLEHALLQVQQDLLSAGAVKENATFRISVQGRERPLNPALKDELFYVGKEALINAFRHAQADNIEVELDYSDRKFRMLVRDDGCGIDPQILKSGRDGHWGLSGMRERAERIGARLHVVTGSPGTEVEVSVAGKLGYLNESPAPRWFKDFRRKQGR